MCDMGQKHRLQMEFLKEGYLVHNQFLTPQQCTYFLDLITQFQQDQNLSVIHRAIGDRPLHYKVINGEQIEHHIPEIAELYQQLNGFVRNISGANMMPLCNKKVGMNVNITPGGGTYRWHYDRNEVTILLYLNEVQGGELEFYPYYRLFVKSPAFLQRLLDLLLQGKQIRRLFGRKVMVKPAQGRLVVIRGNRCLHSVRPVESDQERVNIVLAYDLVERQLVQQQLDQYLYSQEPVSSDPNYTFSQEASQ